MFDLLPVFCFKGRFAYYYEKDDYHRNGSLTLYYRTNQR